MVHRSVAIRILVIIGRNDRLVSNRIWIAKRINGTQVHRNQISDQMLHQIHRQNHHLEGLLRTIWNTNWKVRLNQFFLIYSQTWCMRIKDWDRNAVLGVQFSWKNSCHCKYSAFRASDSPGSLHVSLVWNKKEIELRKCHFIAPLFSP